MKVNVGCGRHPYPGWWNCDIEQHPNAKGKLNALCDARDIPLDDGVASVVMACHVIEHFYQWEVESVLTEWRRILKRGGQLILELPDLELVCRNVLTGLGDQMTMWPLYGDPAHKDSLMCHKWGYTPVSMRELLQSNGFGKIEFDNPQTHGKRYNRDMRVTGVKA